MRAYEQFKHSAYSIRWRREERIKKHGENKKWSKVCPQEWLSHFFFFFFVFYFFLLPIQKREHYEKWQIIIKNTYLNTLLFMYEKNSRSVWKIFLLYIHDAFIMYANLVQHIHYKYIYIISTLATTTSIYEVSAFCVSLPFARILIFPSILLLMAKMSSVHIWVWFDKLLLLLCGRDSNNFFLKKKNGLFFRFPFNYFCFFRWLSILLCSSYYNYTGQNPEEKKYITVQNVLKTENVVYREDFT